MIINPAGGGTATTIDGVKQTGDVDLQTVSSLSVNIENIVRIRLPYSYTYGQAVVYNDEIHILGGTSGRKKHYKWNGSEWVSVSTLPYNFNGGSAVVFNNEIHILGGSYSSSVATYHYKWNGSTWTSVSTLPYEFKAGCAVVYNNQIHILGGEDYPEYYNHYKWTGSTWTSVSTISRVFGGYGAAVVYNGAIHILGGSAYRSASEDHKRDHNLWNGSSWSTATDIPYDFYGGVALIYKNELHIIGSLYETSQTNNGKMHYKWNGSTWTSVSTLPYRFGTGCAVVLNKISLLGGQRDSSGLYWYNYELDKRWIFLVDTTKNLPAYIASLSQALYRMLS